MDKPDYLISTPENVDLHLELAGLGNRILAAVIDHFIILVMLAVIIGTCVGVGIFIEGGSLGADVKAIIYYYIIAVGLFGLFVINFGYFIIFEGFWQGQTPGKRTLQIRVIEQNGHPIGWSSVWIRNIVRVIDELPLINVGLLPMMIDKHERRLGDLAAGTVVVKERLQASGVGDLKVAPSDNVELVIDTGQVSPDEYNLITSFLKRRQFMSTSARQRLAADIAAHFKEKLAVQASAAPSEQLVEKLFLAYKQRAEIENTQRSDAS